MARKAALIGIPQYSPGMQLTASRLNKYRSVCQADKTMQLERLVFSRPQGILTYNKFQPQKAKLLRVHTYRQANHMCQKILSFRGVL